MVRTFEVLLGPFGVVEEPEGPLQPEFVGSATAGGNLATVNVTWPTVQPDDIAYAFWTFISTATQTTPLGFELVTSNDGPTGSLRTCIYRKICVGTEDGGTLAFTNSIANRQSVALVIYRNIDLETPEDSVPSWRAETVAGTTHANPAETPTVANCIIVTSIHERATSIDTAWTPPSGYTERADTLTLATGSGGTITAVADDGLALGRAGGVAVTPPVWTGNHGTGSANVGTYTMALRAAQGSASPLMTSTSLLTSTSLTTQG